MFLLLLTALFIDNSLSINCYYNDTINWWIPTLSKNGTCEGELCIVVKQKDYRDWRYIQTCASGYPMNPDDAHFDRCELDYSDTIVCYCRTDLCNHRNMTLEKPIQKQIVECKTELSRQLLPTFGNFCLLKRSYLMLDIYLDADVGEMETVDAAKNGAAASDIMYTPMDGGRSEEVHLISENFYINACYNVTMHEERHYNVYCRCNQTNCNDPTKAELPFPLRNPSIRCYTSGLSEQIKGASKTEYIKNLLNDTRIEGECSGNYCFIAEIVENVDLDGGVDTEEFVSYYKGCIQTSDVNLQIGLLLMKDIRYHVCDWDNCNVDIDSLYYDLQNRTVLIQKQSSSAISILLSIVFISYHFV